MSTETPFPRPDQNTADNLRRVLAVNHQINSVLDPDRLLSVIMETAAEVMCAEAASLMLLDEKTNELVFKVALGEKGTDLTEKFRMKMGEGIVGAVAASGKSLIVNDPSSDSRFASRVDHATGFTTKAIICVPMRTRDRILGVLEAMNPIERKGFTDSDLELFEAFAEQASIAVENARLHRSLVDQERARQELLIAKQIQRNFLPDLHSLKTTVQIAAESISALEVGGDLYDVVTLEDGRTAIILGDVSGKGVPAALYMVRAISDFRFLVSRSPSAAALLEVLNSQLMRHTTLGMFITLNCIILNPDRLCVEIASAGHHPVLLRTASGEIRALKDPAGLPLGLDPDSRYESAFESLSPGDSLLLYTDGILEARNAKSEEFGDNRLAAAAARGNSAEDIVGQVLQATRDFTGEEPQHDDMTLLALRIP